MSKKSVIQEKPVCRNAGCWYQSRSTKPAVGAPAARFMSIVAAIKAMPVPQERIFQAWLFPGWRQLQSGLAQDHGGESVSLDYGRVIQPCETACNRVMLDEVRRHQFSGALSLATRHKKYDWKISRWQTDRGS